MVEGRDDVSKGSLTVIIALGISVVWLGASAALLAGSASCAGVPRATMEGGNVIRFASDVLANHLLCRPSNEIGDFLAGAFAPLAFIWLTAAVLLQRSELLAQRQELREARIIAGEQVAEAAKHAKFIGEQTELLRQQRLSEEVANADRRVDLLLDVMLDAFRRLEGRVLARGRKSQDAGSGEDTTPTLRLTELTYDRSKIEMLRLCAYSVAANLSQFVSRVPRDDRVSAGGWSPEIKLLIEIMERTLAATDGISEAMELGLRYALAHDSLMGAKTLLEVVEDAERRGEQLTGQNSLP